jgi:hypothetical protein
MYAVYVNMVLHLREAFLGLRRGSRSLRTHLKDLGRFSERGLQCHTSGELCAFARYGFRCSTPKRVLFTRFGVGPRQH